MKIILTDSGIKFSSLMKLVFFGYFIGMGLIGIPFLFLDIFNLKELTHGITGVVIFTIVIFLQGILLGLLINLGLYIYKKFKPIVIEYENNN